MGPLQERKKWRESVIVVKCAVWSVWPRETRDMPANAGTTATMVALLHVMLVGHVCGYVPSYTPLARRGVDELRQSRYARACRRKTSGRVCLPHELRMSFLDNIVGAAKETFREVTVQHILVPSQMEANEIYDAILAEGANSAVVGRYAAEKSTCGSAKKRPDAKLQLLRGEPGELKFRRGSMQKPFEEAAFAAPPGTLVRPFATQSGWHVMLVSDEE